MEVDKGKKKAAGEADPMDVDKGKAAVEGTDEEEIEDNLRTEPGAGTDEERDLRDHPEPRPRTSPLGLLPLACHRGPKAASVSL